MRLLTLDLDRYGPFCGKRLTFRSDARLHIVFGPNEAGKSCSLAAVTDLLFGIERSTRYDFLHAGKDLQIGATIRDRNGGELTFRRRKNKPILTDGGGNPLPDDALAPFTGGISRDVFRRAFGLDADALRKSGDELKHTDGELGAALFSAASGLRGFLDTKAQFEREADGIFSSRKSESRRFYQALDRFESARKKMRECEMRAGALKALQTGREDQEALLGQIRTRRAALASERRRIEQLRRSAPILRAIDADLEHLEELGRLPDAPDGFGLFLSDAVAAAVAAAQHLEAAKLQEAARRSACETIAIDDAILDRSGQIEELNSDLGGYRSALRDLPRVQAEADQANETLTQLAGRLGLADVGTMLASQPDDASRALVAELVQEGERHLITLDTRREERSREQKALAEKKRDRDKRGATTDPRIFREKIMALTPLRRLAEQLEMQMPAFAAEKAKLTESAARLSLSVDDLERLARSPIPSTETMTAFAKRLDDIARTRLSEEQSLAAAQAESESLLADLAVLTGGLTVPSREAIASRRAARDELWLRLKPSLFGRSTLPPPELVEAVAGFEVAHGEADRLADAAIADADRVVAYADKTRRLAIQTDLLLAIRERLADLTRDYAEAQSEWQGIWAAAMVNPRSPAEMQGWKLQLEALLDQRAKLRERQIEIDRKHDEVGAARPAFSAVALDLGLTPMAELSIPALADRIDSEIARLAQHWDLGRQSDALLDDLTTRSTLADQAVLDAENDLNTWRQKFSAALPRIHLTPGAGIAEAEAVLEAWRDVPVASAQREALQRRVAGMQRDTSLFKDNLRDLANEVAGDLTEDEPEMILRTLKQRLAAMQIAHTRREEAQRSLDESRCALREVEATCVLAERAVAAAAAQIHVPVDEKLDGLSRRLIEREATQRSLREKREQLDIVSDGRDESSLRRSLETFDSEGAGAELLRFEQEERDLELEGQKAYAARQEADGQLDKLEGVMEAEIAFQQRRNAEAEMLEAGRDWAVLSVGALMIGAAISRQRLGRREPLMARGSDLFALMTGDAYEGLGQSYDDDDVPHLTGRRPDGKQVKVMDMSEGTRDQLYLALRLAYLEDYAGRSEPPPFIADDLFASFDDERTALGLKAIAACGEKVQPILFTHHGFVVETASRELGSMVDIIALT